MKHVRMLGLLATVVVSMTAGCHSDDDPVKDPSNTSGTGGAGGAGGVSGTGGAPYVGGTTATDAGNATTNADSSTVDTVPEIAGTYFDGFQTHQIAEGFWRIDTSIFHVTFLDNAQKSLVAFNDAKNDWNPGEWSRFDWTRNSQGDLYYCQTTYNSATEQQAKETPRANDSDLSKGCGTLNFNWTKLTPTTADAGN